jgi:hypothetical protein
MHAAACPRTMSRAAVALEAGDIEVLNPLECSNERVAFFITFLSHRPALMRGAITG